MSFPVRETMAIKLSNGLMGVSLQWKIKKALPGKNPPEKMT